MSEFSTAHFQSKDQDPQGLLSKNARRFSGELENQVDLSTEFKNGLILVQAFLAIFI